MKKRLLCLGLLAITQLFATGCFFFHPVARWRANHPCGACHPCKSYHPLLHPVQTRRAILGEPAGAVGPVVTNPPCHGCGNGPGVPVGLNGGPGDVVPITHPPTGYPAIGYPTPLTPGPTVIPSYELPHPMPVPKNNGNGN
jgi:hypothetical protein